MNPAEYGMFWMNQYAPDRMIMDDSTNFYAQPSIGMSVLDDISHQSNAMDLNPMSLMSEYTAATAPGPIAITPDLFGGLPRTATGIAHAHHLFHDDQHHQTILDHYGTLDHSSLTTANGINMGLNVQIAQPVQYDEDANEEEEEGEEEEADENDDEDDTRTAHHTHTQHYDIGVGCDNTMQLHQDDEENDYVDDNSNDVVEHSDDADGYEGTSSGGVGGDGNEYLIQVTNSTAGNGRLIFKKKTKSTQTNRKIKPVKRPGLVLKTPIAYQPCLDPSVIPIQRDGMAVCERCGAIGVKHSFYTKERRFCSMACARGDYLSKQGSMVNNTTTAMATNQTTTTTTDATIANSDVTENKDQIGITSDIELELNATQVQNPNYRFKLSTTSGGDSDTTGSGDYNNLGIDETGQVLYRDIMPEDELPQIPRGKRLPSPCPQEEKIITVRRKPSEFNNSYDWSGLLSNPGFYAAPVTCFPHAPGFDMWSNIGVGMKVEVENTDCDTQGIQQGLMPHSFWVATVLRLCGYKALLRYEGFDNDASHDFWVNLCSSEVHPVGWCATRGKPLIPPRTIENKYSDWKDLLVKRLSGARTLPTTFYNKINESFKSRFRPGLQLEVVNKNRISQMRLATIHKIVGKRLLVRYFDAPDDDGFWVHEDSPLIHPVGWSIYVGHNLSAPSEYLERMMAGREQLMEVHDDDATIDLFKMNFTFEEYFLEGKTSGFIAGMKLEAVDPLNLSSICVATVMEVLKFGYMMIRIDSYDPDVTGADLFCYHEKSACIFPPGFCESNGITLTPPKGYDSNTFSWIQYLRDTNSIAADEKLFYRENTNIGFCAGMKIECADLMDPRLVCVATIAKTVGRILKVHFDGWEDEYDQWLDVQSPDMYPVGWCVLVGHKLEGPPLVPRPQTIQKISPKTTKRGRKKKPLGKIKGRANTPTGLSTRNTTVKKEKEQFEQQKHSSDTDEYSMKMIQPKLESRHEQQYDDDMDGTGAGDDEYDDDYSHDEYSQSVPSLHSLASTPEPRIVTPVQHTASRASNSSTQSSGNSNSENTKVIPRLVETGNSTSGAQNNGSPAKKSCSNSTDNDLSPNSWTTTDVEEFLRVNDCTAHCEAFSRKKVDGKRLLELTKDEIVEMLSMKVGPALKIYDLIQQLKSKLKPSRLSGSKSNNANKKFL